MAEFTLVRHMDASPEAVFDAITDHRRYSDYTPIRRAELEREGDTGRTARAPSARCISSARRCASA